MFSGNILWLESVTSTNDVLKELAAQGAAEGTAVIAREQTAGRGTGARSFFSPAGEGLYLSVLLRPKAELAQLFTLTGRTAVAVRRGIERACGAPCQIKWLNDIYLNGKKLCGILAELSPDGSWVVIGVGVNLSQSRESFAAQGLGEIATSLAAEGYPVTREELTRCILEELAEMYRLFPGGLEECLAEYRAHCLTVGRQVEYTDGGVARTGTATAVDGEFALVVDGHAVRAGTVYLK